MATLTSMIRSTALKLGVNVERVRHRPRYVGEAHRHEYQRRYVDFSIRAGEQVLDIGSGGDPLPEATVLVDRYIQPTQHRFAALDTAGKPLVVADVHLLPFTDKSFDFVYCVHLLEHVDDPLAACREIQRVGKRGYIETPTLAKDLLFSWARGMHKWHVLSIADCLLFFEYSPRLLEGIRSSHWRHLVFGCTHHPLQESFFANQDVFNTMLLWKDRFRVMVFMLDGSIRSLP